jgi:cytochrome c oxidase assembly protein subunit 15
LIAVPDLITSENKSKREFMAMAFSESVEAANVSSEARASKRIVAWLFVLAGLVALMVIIGGATRLTGSGLSITEWQPIVGTVPPLSEADWQAAFAKYKEIPEYKIINRGLGLDGFKYIFWWEWAHRLLGRVVGLAFALPFLYFLARGAITRSLMAKLLVVFMLGTLQGAIGWYMVQSGLTDRTDVSPYRLALHLTVAALIFALLYSVALSLRDNGKTELHGRFVRSTSLQRLAARLIVGLIFLQIALGGLVSGAKAGLSHNTWPLMDGRLIPSGLGAASPWYLNPFENVLTVQFDHRIGAYLLTFAVFWQAVSILGTVGTEYIGRSALLLVSAVLLQVCLGVFALLSQVALAIGLAHQAGAMVVLAVALWHLHRVTH